MPRPVVLLAPPDPAPAPGTEAGDADGNWLEDVLLSLSDPELAALDEELPAPRLGLVEPTPADPPGESDVEMDVSDWVNDDEGELLLPAALELVLACEPASDVELLPLLEDWPEPDGWEEVCADVGAVVVWLEPAEVVGDRVAAAGDCATEVAGLSAAPSFVAGWAAGCEELDPPAGGSQDSGSPDVDDGLNRPPLLKLRSPCGPEGDDDRKPVGRPPGGACPPMTGPPPLAAPAAPLAPLSD